MSRLPVVGRWLGRALLALGTTATTALAQAPPPRMGVFGGFTSATFAGKDIENPRSRSTFMVGVFGQVAFSDVVSLQLEPQFANKGAKLPENGGESHVKLAMIEIPLLFRVNIPTGGSAMFRMQGMDNGMTVTPHLYAGPAVAFRASCKVDATEGSESETFECDELTDVDIKNTDFSLLFGGGVDIGNFTVGVRYDLGLAKLLEGTENDVKSRAFTVYAGFGLPLR